jgi:alkylhydroperoxidase family enzyme
MRMRLLLSTLLGIATSAGVAEPAKAPGSAQEKARTQEILGQPPRIAPRTDLSAEERAMAAPPRGFEDAGELPQIWGVLLHNPDLARKYIPMSSQFMLEGKLVPRDRELAILRNAWLMQAPFIWGEHVPLAKKLVGLTTRDVEAVMAGSASAHWNPHERAVLKAVEELHDQAMIGDATWAVLARDMSKAQLVELPIFVGQYKVLAYFQNALRIELRPGNAGLAAR